MSRGLGTAQQKILLLLLGGLALGLSGSPRRYFWILKTIRKEWHGIDRRALYRAIRGLYHSKLLEEKRNPNGSITLTLSEDGRKKALTYKLDEMKILRPKIWDKKWRLVVFDVPERHKELRDILRKRLRQLDFYELQKSVFIHPFPCNDEIEYIIEFYNVRPYVRQLLAEWVDNELHLKTNFGLG